MKFFDAHCDTILTMIEDGADFTAAPGAEEAPHVTLQGLRDGGVCAQVFACFVLEARYPGRAREMGLQLVDAVRELCAYHEDALVLADTPHVVAAACDVSAAAAGEVGVADEAPEGRTAVIISLEGADPLEGDAEALREFHALGVRLLTLAWDDNPFCGTVFGAAAGGGGGLTPAGRDLVQLCEELGVLVDVSHASDEGFWDVCQVATRPFTASHSDCRAVCSAERNLTDDMIRALAERGGVMGVNLCPSFLSQSFLEQEKAVTGDVYARARASGRSLDATFEEVAPLIAGLPRPPLDTVLAHVKHAIDVGGEDCVGLGGDLDGIQSLPAGIEGVADYPRIADLLRRGGLSERQVEKVCFRNFARLLTQ